MPYSAVRIARLLHQFAAQEKRSITPLELIKLTFLVHGWSLGLRGKALVSDRAEAWQYGPVFPELYHLLKSYRGNPVMDVPPSASEAMDDDIVDDDRAFVKAVFDAYKGFNGVQLSSLTHQSDTPWEKTWKRRGRNSVIPDDMIRQHYKELAEQAPREPA
jgi:uncharacterized phage-associated protein